MIDFYKYQGTGNDFILIDDRVERFNIDNPKLVKSICKRKFGVGSDGLIILRNHEHHDFEMIFFNSAGEKSTFCGNGGRCILSFAKDLGIISKKSIFIAYDGIHEGEINGRNIRLKMADVQKVNVKDDCIVLDTGSPHLIKIVDNLKDLDVITEGRKLRFSKEFGTYGINVNFTEIRNDHVFIRTYERGDEMESLSCGTGSVAAAIALHKIKKVNSQHLTIYTKGGELEVFFKYDGRYYTDIWLSGEARMVYKGHLKC